MMIAAIALSSLLTHSSTSSPLANYCFTKTKSSSSFIFAKCAKPAAALTHPLTSPVTLAPETFVYRQINNHFDGFVNFDTVSSNGFSGTGTGESFRLTTYFNRKENGFYQPQFVNRFTFERTNASQSVILGTLVFDQNDDEDDCEDDFDYMFAPRSLYGAGIGYSHYHPVYLYGAAYDMNGVGFGVDKLPDYSQNFSLYGSLWYYPSISGSGTYNNVKINGSFNAWKYDIGASVSAGTRSPIDFKLGYKFENWTGSGPSSGATYRLSSPYLGAGYRF